MSSPQERTAKTFVERHGLWSDEQFEAATKAERLIEEHGLEVVRLSFPDQHGILRGKTVMAADAARAMRNGVAMTTTLLAKDTAQKTAFPVFTAGGGFGMREMEGGADFLMIADPDDLPRAAVGAEDRLGAVRHLFRQRPAGAVLDPPSLSQRRSRTLADAGYDYMAGLEVEFHVFKLDNPRLAPEDATWPPEAPQVSLISPGYAYLTETRFDQMEPVLETIRREVVALGLPLRSVEIELGPSQCEFTFHPQIGLAPADTMMLFRSAVKQMCRRMGYHASFMCRPKVANVMSSGWHLHQSLRDKRTSANAFVSDADALSPLGRHFLGGLLAHARAAAAFTTPTVNGYKRYRAYALAPDRVIWARDNRGVMVRVMGGAGDPATRLENRIGEPAANPYLYMASQIVTGLDGVARKLDPGPSADTPYETKAELLPKSLDEALAALRDNACLRAGFGSEFVDYYLRLKEAEFARYQAEVTEWEQKEYFELF